MKYVEQFKWMGVAIAAALDVERMEFSKFIERFSGGKRRAYERGHVQYVRIGVQGKDYIMGLHCKADKLIYSKDPRTILSRPPIYNLALGTFISPIEHLLSKLSIEKIFKNIKSRGKFIFKGLTPVQQANLAIKKWSRVPRPRGIGCDASRFDMSCDLEVIQLIEFTVYILAYVGNKELVELLLAQLNGLGYTTDGRKFTAPARHSGCSNTGIGNSIIMMCMIISFFFVYEAVFPIWEGWCNGDDANVVVSAECEELFRSLFPLHCKKWGFDMVLEPTAYHPFEMEFCQCKIVQLDSKNYMYVRNPERVLTNVMSTSEHNMTEKRFLEILWSTGLCELHLNSGVPVLQEAALWMIRNGYAVSDERFAELVPALSYRYSGIQKHHSKVRAIQPVARVSFEQAWGVSVVEQRYLERKFSENNFKVGCVIRVEAPSDPGGEGKYTEVIHTRYTTY